MASKTSRASKTPAYKCAECGWTAIKWVGRCGECQAWGTVEEYGATVARTTAAATVLELTAVSPRWMGRRRPSCLPAWTSWTVFWAEGWSLVPSSCLPHEPGVGKSTLLLDVAAKFARTGQDVLYITGEESAAQVKLRAERIDAVAHTLYLSAETDLGQALGQVEKLEPKLLIVDSVQTLSSADVEGSAGGVSQVREVAASIISAAKRRNMTTLLVGHVTKEGTIAGPRLLEHLVDVVCQFEGERHSRLRLLRAVKNRYGATDDVGCFDLNETGIEGLADPSGLFVSRTREPVSGTCITVTMEGHAALAGRGSVPSRRERQFATTAGHQRIGEFPRSHAAGSPPAACRLHAPQGRFLCGNSGRREADRTGNRPGRCPGCCFGQVPEGPPPAFNCVWRGGLGR